MRDIQSVHEEKVPQITDTIGIDFELLPKKRAKTVKYISEAICAITASFVMAIGILLSVEFEALVGPLLVREAEVILPTFSRDKSILLLNCPLHA